MNREKFNELKLIAQNYDLIMLTETWFTVDKECLYNLDGFCLHTCNRANRRSGGGVAIYARNTISVKNLDKFSNRSISAYWMLMQQERQPPIIFVILYHPPGLPVKSKEQTIEHIISNISKHLKKYPTAKIFITGDFNDLDTEPITNILPVEQIVNFPTRGDNKLDLIFTDIPEYIKSGCNSLPPILTNDHVAIHVSSTNRIHTPKYRTIKKRIVTPASKVAVTAELCSHNWENLYAARTADEKVYILHNDINSILDKHCPYRSVRVPQGKPVITTPLIRKLSRAKKRAHSKNSPSWKAISKVLSIKLKEQLANQTSDNVNNAIHGSKNWWMNVKDLIGESPQVSFCPLISMNNRWLNMTQFVNELNSYYLSDHDSYIPDFPDMHVPETVASCYQTNEMAVYALLSKLNTSKSTNTEDFPTWVSKNNAHLITQPMTDIINTVLKSGQFPRLWKRAEITPLNKVKSPQTFKQLRPISLLFHLGKVTESVISGFIKQDLPQLKDQFAYTKNFSTTDALVKFITDIVHNLDDDKNLAAQALLLDFSKAFDKMLPHLAVKKLVSLGVRPEIVQVVKSFFCCRIQKVKYSDVCSPYQPCNIGVPQGTIMGPLLWNIFVNDFRPAINCIKYADDTTVYNIVHNGDVSVYNSTSHKASLSFSHLGNPIQQAADYASTWCRHNSMLLNAAKSQLITFTLQKSVHSVPVTVNDIIIEENNSVKLLGVHVDTHLRFSNHVDSIIAKVKPATHALVQLKKVGVTPSSLTVFYRSRILSLLSYAAPSWFPFLSNNDKMRLERLQKLCLRVILPSCDEYDQRLSILGLQELSVYLDICCLKYAAKISQTASHPLRQYIPPIQRTGKTRHIPLARPKCRTSLCSKSFFYKYF